MINSKKKTQKGGRNLVLLGLISTIIAITTTGVSLAVYHNSGDIYLDRSRPGFLPDEEEIEEEVEEEEQYVFDKSGALSIDVLEEYLEKLRIETDAIDAYAKPFDAKVLSDEALGIPADEQKEDGNK